MTLTIMPYDQWQKVQEVELQRWTGTDSAMHLRSQRQYQEAVLRKFRISGLMGLVVDVASGPCSILEQVEGNFLGVAVDPLVPQFLKVHPLFSTRLALQAWCAEDLQLPSLSVHHVICTDALNQFRDPSRALEEMARILKPGGTLWLHWRTKTPVQPADVNQFLRERLALEWGEIFDYRNHDDTVEAFQMVCRKEYKNVS